MGLRFHDEHSRATIPLHPSVISQGTGLHIWKLNGVCKLERNIYKRGSTTCKAELHWNVKQLRWRYMSCRRYSIITLSSVLWIYKREMTGRGKVEAYSCVVALTASVWCCVLSGSLTLLRWVTAVTPNTHRSDGKLMRPACHYPCFVAWCRLHGNGNEFWDRDFNYKLTRRFLAWKKKNQPQH